jgi:hypothetical protein
VEEDGMPWFVCCDAARLFFDKEGDVSYVAEVKKHECKPIDENLEDEAATWSSAGSRVAISRINPVGAAH